LSILRCFLAISIFSQLLALVLCQFFCLCLSFFF
jgi:hypothetical protein